jgi:hypothetical protein
MKKSLINLTKNKYVFYVVSLLAILNVLGYFSMRSWECIVMFAAVAYSANCYAKNATISLLAGLFVSNFVFGCNQVKESFVEANDPEAKIGKMLEKVAENAGKEKEECKDGDEREECQKKEDKATNLAEQVKQLSQQGPAKDAMSNIMSALTNMGK